jgi:NADH:ubiquinone oxidoreductase subunit 2 (subunit N)
VRDFSLLFAIYTPVYVYALLVVYFAVYMAVSTPRGAQNTLASFFSGNKTWLHSFLFLATILAILGTPPTLGFFGKLLTFYLLARDASVPLLAALLFTIFMLVFYLQSTRAKAYARRRAAFRASPLDLKYALLLLHGQILLLGFAFFLPAAVDVLAAAFM